MWQSLLCTFLISAISGIIISFCPFISSKKKITIRHISIEFKHIQASSILYNTAKQNATPSHLHLDGMRHLRFLQHSLFFSQFFKKLVKLEICTSPLDTLTEQFLLHCTSDQIPFHPPNIYETYPFLPMFIASTSVLAPSFFTWLLITLFIYMQYAFLLSHLFSTLLVGWYFKMWTLIWFYPTHVFMVYLRIPPLLGALIYTYFSHLPC